MRDTTIDEEVVGGRREVDDGRRRSRTKVGSLQAQGETTKPTKADDAAVDVKGWDSKLVAGFGLDLDSKTAERAALVVPKYRPGLHGICAGARTAVQPAGQGRAGPAPLPLQMGSTGTGSVLLLVGGSRRFTLQGLGESPQCDHAPSEQ
jgi:hypothetical protein